MTTTDVIETAVVRFHAGRAIVLIHGERITTPQGYDDTHTGFATFPGSSRPVRVHRIGLGYWKQLGA